MRILSQDGGIDLPYENFSLSITQDNCIVAARDVVARPTEMLIGTVAKYSSFEKAQKAMEMLRKAYSPILVIQEQENGIEPNIKPNDFIVGTPLPTPKVDVLDNFYFQFPTDDEIEV